MACPLPLGPDTLLPTSSSSWLHKFMDRKTLGATFGFFGHVPPPALGSSWYQAEVFLCLCPGRVWSLWSLLKQGTHHGTAAAAPRSLCLVYLQRQGPKAGKPVSPREGGPCLVDRAASSGLVAVAKSEGSSSCLASSSWIPAFPRATHCDPVSLL